MKKHDKEDKSLALTAGSLGTLIEHETDHPKIKELETQLKVKSEQIYNLQKENITKDFIIAQKDEEIRKLKAENKNKNSVKDIIKSLFDKI